MEPSSEFAVLAYGADGVLLRRPLRGLYRTIPNGRPLSKSRELSIRLLGGGPHRRKRRLDFALFSRTSRWEHGGRFLRLPLGTSRSEAEKLAVKFGADSPITFLRSQASVGLLPLFREIARYEIVDTLELLSEAIEVGRELSRRDALQKQINPLTDTGIHELTDRIAGKIARVTLAEEERSLRQALRRPLEADWVGLRGAALATAVATLVRPIRDLYRRVTPRTVSILEDEAGDLVRSVRRALSRRHSAWNLSVSLNRTDRRIARHVVDSQANFIRDEYGRRAVAASETARRLVSRGVGLGLGRAEIARMLNTAMVAGGINRSLAYWHVVASSFANRARSFAQLSAFRDAGVQVYEITAVLDEVTTHFCRWADSKRLRVDSGLELFDRVRRLRDPEDIRLANPWVFNDTDAQGRPGMYVRTGLDSRRRLARVTRSGLGNRDDRGEYANEMSAEDLKTVNIGPPPYHALCRTTIIPVI